jgi:hypothetical protein
MTALPIERDIAKTDGRLVSIDAAVAIYRNGSYLERNPLGTRRSRRLRSGKSCRCWSDTILLPRQCATLVVALVRPSPGCSRTYRLTVFVGLRCLSRCNRDVRRQGQQEPPLQHSRH